MGCWVHPAGSGFTQHLRGRWGASPQSPQTTSHTQWKPIWQLTGSADYFRIAVQNKKFRWSRVRQIIPDNQWFFSCGFDTSGMTLCFVFLSAGTISQLWWKNSGLPVWKTLLNLFIRTINNSAYSKADRGLYIQQRTLSDPYIFPFHHTSVSLKQGSIHPLTWQSQRAHS